MGENDYPYDQDYAELKDERNRFAVAIANVVTFTAGRTDVTHDEICALIRGEIPARLR